jgi:hypothetical protein
LGWVFAVSLIVAVLEYLDFGQSLSLPGLGFCLGLNRRRHRIQAGLSRRPFGLGWIFAVSLIVAHLESRVDFLDCSRF